MREAFNRLNELLALLALPLYLFFILGAMISMISIAFPVAATWPPAWLQFIATSAYILVEFGLIIWSVFAVQLGSQRVGADMVWVDTLFGDGISGYLLMARLVVAAFVLKWAFL